MTQELKVAAILPYELFVGWLMLYLSYLCLSVLSGVQHILCCALALYFSLFVPYVVSFSGLSILIAPSVFSNVYILKYEDSRSK